MDVMMILEIYRDLLRIWLGTVPAYTKSFVQYLQHFDYHVIHLHRCLGFCELCVAKPVNDSFCFPGDIMLGFMQHIFFK
jgi:hypothetical protein